MRMAPPPHASFPGTMRRDRALTKPANAKIALMNIRIRDNSCFLVLQAFLLIHSDRRSCIVQASACAASKVIWFEPSIHRRSIL